MQPRSRSRFLTFSCLPILAFSAALGQQVADNAFQGDADTRPLLTLQAPVVSLTPSTTCRDQDTHSSLNIECPFPRG